MPELSTRQVLSYLRMGLVTGLIDKEALVAWADAEILRQPTPDEHIIALALAGKRSYSFIIWQLSDFQGEPDYELALRLLFARAGVAFECAPGSAADIIMGLRLLNEEQYLPEMHRREIADLTDALARQRAGDVSAAALAERLAALLAKYVDARPLLVHLP